MKLICIVVAIVGAQAQTTIDGVWLPRHIADLGAGIAVPFQPWAKAKFEANHVLKQNELDLRCLPPGLPRINLMSRPFEIVQTPERILFIYEGGAHVWRQVWMDGRPHPKDPNPDWLGDSIGHWEQNTLVVDSVGFNDRTWLDDAGHPHTEQLHVVERYRRPNFGTLDLEVTVEDPGAYTRPFTISGKFSLLVGKEIRERSCYTSPVDK